MSKIALSGNASGTGTFTFASPNSSTDRTLTLPDNTGTIITTASTFAGTGPAFRAYQSSQQTLSNTTFTKLQFQAEDFDTNSNFDSTTNYRFTPTVAGYYQLGGGFSVGASATGLLAVVYKNGSQNTTINNNNGSNTSGAYGSALFYANGTTDYFELYGYMVTGQVLSTATGAVYFYGFLARAA